MPGAGGSDGGQPRARGSPGGIPGPACAQRPGSPTVPVSFASAAAPRRRAGKTRLSWPPPAQTLLPAAAGPARPGSRPRTVWLRGVRPGGPPPLSTAANSFWSAALAPTRGCPPGLQGFPGSAPCSLRACSILSPEPLPRGGETAPASGEEMPESGSRPRRAVEPGSAPSRASALATGRREGLQDALAAGLPGPPSRRRIEQL